MSAAKVAPRAAKQQSADNNDGTPPHTTNGNGGVPALQTSALMKSPQSPQSVRARSTSPSASRRTLSAGASQAGGGGSYNLDNFLTSRTTLRGGRVLTSPRSIEVCQRFGINPEDLLPRPLDSFVSGTPRSSSSAMAMQMAQRRYDHFETKRMQKLTLLRDERKSMIDRESEMTPCRSPARSPRSVTSAVLPSPARLAMKHNAEIQKVKAQLQRLEREREALAKQEKLSGALQHCAENRAAHVDEVAHKGEQHWEQVAATKEHAENLFANKNEQQRHKSAQNDHLRVTRSDSASLKRSTEWKFKSLTRKQHEEEVRSAERKRFAMFQKWSEDKWRHIEGLSDQAKMAHIQEMEKRIAENAKHIDHVQEVNAAAHAIEDSEYVQKAAKVENAEAEISAKLALKARVEQDTHERRKQVKESEIDAARSRERGRRENRRQTLVEQQTEKQRKLRELQDRLNEEKLWSLETQRERIEDHKEEVSRVKRAKEYERRQRVLETMDRKDRAFQETAEVVRQQNPLSGASCSSLLGTSAIN